MFETCGDNRFEIIEKAKKDILDATNISASPDEMKVLDSFLFRCWQMGWLGQYDDTRMREVRDEGLKDCEWCIPDNEVCGTCESYFAVDEKDRCAANPDDASCVAWKPMGFCPKCGRALRGSENDEKSNG